MEYCEHCGNKDAFMLTKKEDYEKHLEKAMNHNSNLDEKYYIMIKERQKREKSARRSKKRKAAFFILIVISAILIIDIVGFFILMNRLNIPLNEIGDALPILFNLILFSTVGIAICIVIAIIYVVKRSVWWRF
ncbi:MAG: hypothetical protein ACFFD1_15765 [Candidatus Thorarchaeota archaeon]